MENRKDGFATERELDDILPRTSRKRQIIAGTFPPPRQLSEYRVGTPWEEIYAWMDALPVSTITSPNVRGRKRA